MKKLSILFAGVLLFAVVGVVKADKPSDMGFDDNGYNDNARIFNGTGSSWCIARGESEYCLGAYSADKLIMKWNAEWDRGNAENWANPPYRAWENNEWNGMFEGGSGSVWHYKIVSQYFNSLETLLAYTCKPICIQAILLSQR